MFPSSGLHSQNEGEEAEAGAKDGTLLQSVLWFQGAIQGASGRQLYTPKRQFPVSYMYHHAFEVLTSLVMLALSRMQRMLDCFLHCFWRVFWAPTPKSSYFPTLNRAAGQGGIRNVLHKFFGGAVKPMVTRCISTELRALGPQFASKHLLIWSVVWHL